MGIFKKLLGSTSDPTALVYEAQQKGSAVHANNLRACGDDYAFAKAVLEADRLGVDVQGKVPGWVYYYEDK